jgi:hypothetical protein
MRLAHQGHDPILAPFPLPGWTVRYSGLSDWPFIEEVTESVSLNHSYNAEYQTSFNSLATAGDPEAQDSDDRHHVRYPFRTPRELATSLAGVEADTALVPSWAANLIERVGNTLDAPLATRTAKALFLLSQVETVPRTAENLARLLAHHVEVDPEPSSVPPGWRYGGTRSLVRAEKSAGAHEAYNHRKRECAEARRARRAGLEQPAARPTVVAGMIRHLPLQKRLTLPHGMAGGLPVFLLFGCPTDPQTVRTACQLIQ